MYREVGSSLVGAHKALAVIHRVCHNYAADHQLTSYHYSVE